MLWDPKRFPIMIYEIWKQYGIITSELLSSLPWHTKLLLKLYFRLPQSLSEPKDVKKFLKFFGRLFGEKGRRDFIMEYVEDVSKNDEHYFRVYENVECWGFKNIGTTIASMFPPAIAGGIQGFDRQKRNWNAIETKCMGLGDPYCEWKLVPGEIDGLQDSLKKDIFVLERIHDRLMNQLMGFLLDEQPLIETRSRLGNDYFMGMGNLAVIAGGDRYLMALRMGAAKAGKEAGENLMNAGVSEDESIKRVLRFLEHCKVGKVTIDKTIRIKENIESVWTKAYTTEKWEEPLCYFTTGFLNGFFSAVKNQHVKETKCIAMGDPYCEWEFRK
jgi:predicted hydrocarbon binding protein